MNEWRVWGWMNNFTRLSNESCSVLYVRTFPYCNRFLIRILLGFLINRNKKNSNEKPIRVRERTYVLRNTNNAQYKQCAMIRDTRRYVNECNTETEIMRQASELFPRPSIFSWQSYPLYHKRERNQQPEGAPRKNRTRLRGLSTILLARRRMHAHRFDPTGSWFLNQHQTNEMKRTIQVQFRSLRKAFVFCTELRKRIIPKNRFRTFRKKHKCIA
jgi:hypothetical protein